LKTVFLNIFSIIRYRLPQTQNELPNIPATTSGYTDHVPHLCGIRRASESSFREWRIAGGVLLGPSLLGWIEPSQTFRLLAEIGINLLLFEVGLIFAELERVNDILVNNVYVTTIIVIALTTLLPLRAQGILQSLRQPILRGELTVWQSAEFIMF
jgi:hypothetical protein